MTHPSSHRLALPTPVLSVLALLLLAFAFIAVPQPAAAGFKVGYVDTELVMKGHPKFVATQKAVSDYRALRMKELDSYKGRSLTETEKKELLVKNETIAAEVDLKHDSLFAPLANDVQSAMDATGKASGVEVIIEKAAVHFGGIDLTPAVITELQKYK